MWFKCEIRRLMFFWPGCEDCDQSRSKFSVVWSWWKVWILAGFSFKTFISVLLVCSCFVFKKMEHDVFWEVNPHKFYNVTQCLVMVSLFIVCSDSWRPRACLRMQIQHPSFMWTNLKKETEFSSCSWLMYHAPRSGKTVETQWNKIEHVDPKLDYLRNWV